MGRFSAGDPEVVLGRAGKKTNYCKFPWRFGHAELCCGPRWWMTKPRTILASSSWMVGGRRREEFKGTTRWMLWSLFTGIILFKSWLLPFCNIPPAGLANKILCVNCYGKYIIWIFNEVNYYSWNHKFKLRIIMTKYECGGATNGTEMTFSSVFPIHHGYCNKTNLFGKRYANANGKLK